jgi:hypothetical protein
MPPHFEAWFSRAVGFPFIIHVWWRRRARRRQWMALLRDKKATSGQRTSASRT